MEKHAEFFLNTYQLHHHQWQQLIYVHCQDHIKQLLEISCNIFYLVSANSILSQQIC